ncbi:Ras-like GTP-binding protein YPT1 [Tritrichomonas foetus]|uniref:Ras-like GTP-binding protein YPT1 n=1 Tax=Tritrichomonas foetus TaxID=1144522 RepID=A0A1J4JCW9_9EUKA|nr:Ras-like GTP-binding protein YPT1 [Tritrichomonas foetus]|eukprot:OHS96529.1 Ras-like GTP-binding protein YPT1 [Tritrichomonas foetus]
MLPHSEQTYKIILLGNSGVGKTSLANRWINNLFDNNVVSTICAINWAKTILVDGRSYSITIWDTAGQEQFRSITPLYVRGAKGIVVVASMCDRESFDGIPDWLDMLNILEDRSVPVILAVNKTDQSLISDDELNEMIDSYKDTFCTVIKVSALTGEKVKMMFEYISSLAVKHKENISELAVDTVKLEPDTKPCC